MQTLTERQRKEKVQHVIDVECCLAGVHNVPVYTAMRQDRYVRLAGRIKRELQARRLTKMDGCDLLTRIYRTMAQPCAAGWHRMFVSVAPYRHNRQRGQAIRAYRLALVPRKEAV